MVNLPPQDLNRLDQIRELLKDQLSHLEQMSETSLTIRDHLVTIYTEKFPKTCGTCGNVYENRAEYLRATMPLYGQSTIAEKDKVHEYRNCRCDSTFLIVTDDRRVTTRVRAARRNLFDSCITLLVEKLSMTQDDARRLLRHVFREVIGEVERDPEYWRSFTEAE